MPMKNPPHPGDFIRTEIIGPGGLVGHGSSGRAACVPSALSSLLNGNADLSGDMALRIEKVFGVRMDTLMRMQASYDIAQTRKPEKTIMPGGFPNQQMPMCEETVVALTVAPRSLS